VKRQDFEPRNEFESVDHYLTYRRGFGTPSGASRAYYERYLDAIRRRAQRDVAPDGTLEIGWTLTLITATAAPG